MKKKNRKKQQRTEYPAATLAFYGPNDKLATKVVIGIMPSELSDVEELHRWISKAGDVRQDPDIEIEIMSFLQEHNVKSVVSTDRIIGCPHEEGKDYPKGTDCLQCPFWVGRDRFTGELK